MADPKYDLPNYALSRLRYYDGQFLKDEDFIDEQKHHLDRRYRHDRLLHVAGVADGLAASAADASTVKVTAGTAVDDLGRQILLGADRTLAVDPTWVGKFALTVSFREKEDRLVEHDGVSGNTRFSQDPLFAIVATTAPPAEHAVRLGTVEIPSAGAAVQVTPEGRTYSGLNLPGAGAPRTLRAKGDAAPELVELEGALSVTRSLSVAQSLAVVGDGAVLGKLGVGTPAPQVALHVAGDARLQGDLAVDKGAKVTQNLTVGGTLGVGVAAVNPAAKLDVAGAVRANRYRGENALVLNDFTTINPASNVYLYSPLDDRDAWLYLDAADTATNWGLYHRQINSPVKNLPANAIGFIGGGASALQAYVSLANGNAFFNGNVGVGRQIANDKLEVAGPLRICTDANPIRFTSDWSSFPNTITNGAEISNDTGTFKTLMIVGNRSAGLDRRVSVWDRLEVNGTLYVNGNTGIGIDKPQARLHVAGGAIMPQHGNSANAGVYFPPNPGGGGGDAAWLRYYAQAGEQTVLELGIANDADDHIALMASGNVGIGTTTPKSKLDIHGYVALHGKHALRGDDVWLRLNQAGEFTAGVHTPGLFCPMSLNVGGANSYGNPGTNNVWVLGDVTVYGSIRATTLSQHHDGNGGRNANTHHQLALGDNGVWDANYYRLYLRRDNGTYSNQIHVQRADGISSSGARKKDIVPVSEDECHTFLEEIMRTELVHYRLRHPPSEAEDLVHLGIIAEDAPAEIVDHDRSGLELGDYCAFLMAGIKALKREVDALRAALAAERGGAPSHRLAEGPPTSAEKGSRP